MKILNLLSIGCLLCLFLVTGTACKEDENKLPDNEYAIPLNMEDKRYADEKTYFTLREHEGILEWGKDKQYYMIYPDSKGGGFEETLLPIRLPDVETILKAVNWQGEDINTLHVIFSGEVKGKEKNYYPIVLTEIRVIFMIPFAAKK